jgi:hypothetical protein
MGLYPLVEYSFDYDDYLRDERIDERREQDRIDEMRRESFEDDFRRDAERDRAEQAMREVVNNPNIIIDNDLQKIVNDAEMVMDTRGKIRKMDSRARSVGRSTIKRSGQFRRDLILPRKRTRKKTKMDRTMSKCLKMANKKMRKKNGQLRKGKTMRDVMRLAHRLCKKE